MGSGINIKINKFFDKPKDVKKRNTRLEKCHGLVNIATAFYENENRRKRTAKWRSGRSAFDLIWTEKHTFLI